jgi:hypothetical protein
MHPSVRWLPPCSTFIPTDLVVSCGKRDRTQWSSPTRGRTPYCTQKLKIATSTSRLSSLTGSFLEDGSIYDMVLAGQTVDQSHQKPSLKRSESSHWCTGIGTTLLHTVLIGCCVHCIGLVEFIVYWQDGRTVMAQNILGCQGRRSRNSLRKNSNEEQSTQVTDGHGRHALHKGTMSLSPRRSGPLSWWPRAVKLMTMPRARLKSAWLARPSLSVLTPVMLVWDSWTTWKIKSLTRRFNAS